MSYQQEYQQKLTTAQEAVKVVKSGDWVDYGWCTNTAEVLDQALAGRMGELHDVKVRGGILLHMPAIAQIENPADHFTWNSWHMSGVERKMVKMGLAYYAPIRYSELPGYYRNCIEPMDVAMFQVAPMDAHGYFNFGPNASHLAAVCETSRTICASGPSTSSWRSTRICPAAWVATTPACTSPRSTPLWRAPTAPSAPCPG